MKKILLLLAAAPLAVSAETTETTADTIATIASMPAGMQCKYSALINENSLETLWTSGERVPSTDGSIILAGCATLSGDYGTAIRNYKVAIERTGSANVMLMLAGAYAKSGNTQMAVAELEKALKSGLSEKIKPVAEAMLEQVRQGREQANLPLKPVAGADAISPFRAQLRAGLVYDSNVNVGSGEDSINIDGYIYKLGNSTKGRPDHARHIGAEAEYSWESVRLGVELESMNYGNMNDYDQDRLAVSVTPAWLQGNMHIRLPVQAEIQTLGANPYSRSIGITPAVDIPVGGMSLTLSGGINFQKFDNQPSHDGPLLQAVATLKKPRLLPWVSSDVGMVSVGVVRDDAREDALRRTMGRVGASYFVSVTENLMLNLNASYSVSKFGGEDSIFGVTRMDHRVAGGVGVSREFGKAGALNVSVSGEKNDSNISLNSFSRKTVSTEWVVRF